MCTLEEKEKESKMRTQTVRYRVYEEWITHPQLAALMQQEDLEPCHLLDVEEDYLNGM